LVAPFLPCPHPVAMLTTMEVGSQTYLP
jgi:hypothetical protein